MTMLDTLSICMRCLHFLPGFGFNTNFIAEFVFQRVPDNWEDDREGEDSPNSEETHVGYLILPDTIHYADYCQQHMV